jgi:DNA-binding CsgD family transcriptional regulator/PAS domain-containing protein
MKPSSPNERIDDVIAGLYEAAALPEHWPDALTGLTELVGGRFSHFLLWDERENRCLTSVIGAPRGGAPDPAQEAAYGAYYGSIDPRRPLTSKVMPGKVVSCTDLVDEATVAKSEFFQDFMLPNDVRWALMVSFPVVEQTYATFGILRAPRAESFHPAEQALTQSLVGHFRRAASLGTKLAKMGGGRDWAAAAWDRASAPMLVVDGHGLVLVANAAARDMIQPSNGIVLRYGRLRATDPTTDDRLAQAVRQALPRDGRGQGTSHAIPVPRAMGRPLAAIVAPLPVDGVANLVGSRPAALILLSDPDTKPTPRGRHLVEIFGLTPAEARLAIDLASGERVEEISVRRGLKVSTVRSQLSSILAKTGTTGQTALLRLLGGVPAVGAD